MKFLANSVVIVSMKETQPTPASRAMQAEARHNDLLLEAARLINALDMCPIERADIVLALTAATRRTR